MIPVFNEKNTILTILEQVSKLTMSKEVIVVDNCSTDGTRELLLNNKHKIDNLILQRINLGKGNSVRAAISSARGEYAVIQDADLEYDPQSFYAMLKRIEEGGCDAVYGSRVLGGKKTRYASYYMGVRILTLMINFLFGANLSDSATTYKMVRTEALKKIPLKCNGFDLDFELTLQLCKRTRGIAEIPVSYTPRTFSEGKKIRAWDGLISMYVILKGRIFG